MTNGVLWTEEDVKFLVENFPKTSKYELSEMMGRSFASIDGKIKRLKLKKTKEEINYVISKGMLRVFRDGRRWARVRQNGLYTKRRERNRLMISLGGKCVNCGISDLDVLNFDHINNDGSKDRGKSILELVKKSPERFQPLCANCNLKKEIFRRELDRLQRLNIPPL